MSMDQPPVSRSEVDAVLAHAMTVPLETIPGVRLAPLRTHHDARGLLAKSPFPPFGFCEAFHTVSHEGTLRGLHFQAPPFAHEKMVTCIHGNVLDVIVDLRRSSPTFGRHASTLLRGDDPHALLLPIGIAHGFLALMGECIVSYMTTGPHSPEHDAGVRWDSIGFDWPVEAFTGFLTSPRDSQLPALADISPFA